MKYKCENIRTFAVLVRRIYIDGFPASLLLLCFLALPFVGLVFSIHIHEVLMGLISDPSAKIVMSRIEKAFFGRFVVVGLLMCLCCAQWIFGYFTFCCAEQRVDDMSPRHDKWKGVKHETYKRVLEESAGLISSPKFAAALFFAALPGFFLTPHTITLMLIQSCIVAFSTGIFILVVNRKVS